MRQCVLVARLPFTNVTTRGGNMNSDPSVELSCTSGSTIGSVTLNNEMKPNHLYTVILDGKLETENTYLMLMGEKDGGVVTTFSNYGEVWTGEEKHYICHFVCNDEITRLSTLRLGIGASSDVSSDRIGTASNIKVYEGFVRM